MKDNPRIICIVQARMSSSRLPGKVLKYICGHPMIYWVVKRARKSKLITDLVVATTNHEEDSQVSNWCQENKIKCYRGDAFDVLDRYYQAAVKNLADIVVRITADCPLIDPELIDELIGLFIDKKVDFAANRLPPPYKRTYPIGLDIEITSFSALEDAWQNAKKPFEREHVMPYLYSLDKRFSTYIHDAEKNFGNHRWTVDAYEDLEFVRALFNIMHCRIDFTWHEVLKIVERNPELVKINADINHKSYLDIDGRATDKSKEKK